MFLLLNKNNIVTSQKINVKKLKQESITKKNKIIKDL